MSEGSKQQAARGAGEPAPAVARQSFCSWRWVVAAVAAVVVTPALLVGGVAMSRSGKSGQTVGEVTLGDFQFVAPLAPEHSIRRAEFRLHVSLLEQAERPGRHLLTAKRYRVQQRIEQLLRRAHGGDFQDPALTELRRQLQEAINETLGRCVVEEVIITDLCLERAAGPFSPAPGSDGKEVAGAAPGRPADPT
jgi:hypothetical protein